MLKWLLAAALMLVLSPVARAEDPPIFDAHLHYNWEPKPYFSREEVLALFRKHNITGILATSRPNDGTRDLVAANAERVWVVPFIRPYRIRADIGSWFNDPAIYDLVVSEFARGGYRGIGEFHLSAANADSDWVRKTVDFAVANNLVLHAHADDVTIERLFKHNPKARIIWAHTGFSLPASRVGEMLAKYRDLWGELSYRGGITDGTTLTPEWRDLFIRFPDRFLIGSDTWIDARWASYGDIIATYRGWLAQLPSDVATAIAHRNAERIFRAPQ